MALICVKNYEYRQLSTRSSCTAIMVGTYAISGTTHFFSFTTYMCHKDVMILSHAHYCAASIATEARLTAYICLLGWIF